jgi:hypothetical protein
VGRTNEVQRRRTHGDRPRIAAAFKGAPSTDALAASTALTATGFWGTRCQQPVGLTLEPACSAGRRCFRRRSKWLQHPWSPSRSGSAIELWMVPFLGDPLVALDSRLAEKQSPSCQRGGRDICR